MWYHLPMGIIRDMRWFRTRLDSLQTNVLRLSELRQQGEPGLMAEELRQVVADARALLRALEDGVLDF